MIIRKATRSDLEVCRRISEAYIKDTPSFLCITEQSSTDFIAREWAGGQMRVIEIDSCLIGWFGLSLSSPFKYSYSRVVSLAYLHFTISGRDAVRTIIEVHEFLKDYAVRNDYDVALSSSVLPSQKGFERLLQKNGWKLDKGWLSFIAR